MVPTFSTSSGMCVHAIEPDVSISSMMFGLPWTAALAAIGVCARSVSAACDGCTRPQASATGQRAKARLTSRFDAAGSGEDVLVMRSSLIRAGSVQDDLGVADRVAGPDDAGGDAEVRLERRREGTHVRVGGAVIPGLVVLEIRADLSDGLHRSRIPAEALDDVLAGVAHR